ncbi:MAG: phytanoyl-CoA dioxygenase family protein [Chloroflexi bacterium]|nr:phytanoyl-CoA dioxygenase family protein [Chloroflexota bacterium]
MASAIPVDRERFEQEGYLLIEQLFDPVADLDPVVLEYTAQLDKLAAEWSARGLIASTYAGLPFSERFARVLNDMGPDGYRPFDITLSGPISEDSPMHTGPAVFELITHPRLLDVVEQLIGPEILSNPIQHVRIKPPEHLLNQKFHGKNTMVSATEWHQDQGVATIDVDGTEMLTVWFPVFDTTTDNGCLCVVPRSHQRGLLLHCPSKPGQVFDLRIPEVIRGSDGLPLEMKRGSVLFMHRLTMHSSLRNRSNGVRWSFDLRYQPIGQPTGRDWLPAFVARSRTEPAREVHDWQQWADLWWKSRRYVAAHPGAMKPRRWTGTETACA